MDQMNLLLRDLSAQNPRTLFYPSAGKRHRGLLKLGYDVYVLADYEPTREWIEDEARARDQFVQKLRLSGQGLRVLERFENGALLGKLGNQDQFVFIFFQDNNSVLHRLLETKMNLSCFVGVNDGCCEGGNYECVNERKWLNKVFELFGSEVGHYVTDHSSFLKPETAAKIGGWRLVPDANRHWPYLPFLSEELLSFAISSDERG